MSSVWALAVPFSLFFMAFSGQVSIPGFVVGYVFSAGALWLGQAYNLNFKQGRVLSQTQHLLIYSAVLARDIFVSSVQVAGLVLSPNMNDRLEPGVSLVETQDHTKNEIITAMSAHGITITPGEMVIDIEEHDDKVVLHVHNLIRSESEPTLYDNQTRRLELIRKVLGYKYD